MTGAEEKWMRRALHLAAKGCTPPNPMVGCTIVRDGVVVGEGYHVMAGSPHAEANALAAAGPRARGATAYITLEPCCYQGRTPPCADALIAAGIARAVVATLDPNPRVNGEGAARLRRAGIAVEVGMLEASARALNAHFFHFHHTGTPYVTLKAAMSMDGKTAAVSGASKWITGETARRYVHTRRARAGAVMVGIETLLADDPQLTARTSPPAPRQPVRIVVDSRLRTPPGCRAVRAAAPECPLLIAATSEASKSAERLLKRDGLEVLRTPPAAGRVDLADLMAQLANRGIISVLVEGGGTLNASLIEMKLAHAVQFFYAPVIIGGEDARTAVEGRGVTELSEAARLGAMSIRRLGRDICIEAPIVYCVHTV